MFSKSRREIIPQKIFKTRQGQILVVIFQSKTRSFLQNQKYWLDESLSTVAFLCFSLIIQASGILTSIVEIKATLESNGFAGLKQLFLMRDLPDSRARLETIPTKSADGPQIGDIGINIFFWFYIEYSYYW